MEGTFEHLLISTFISAFEFSTHSESPPTKNFDILSSRQDIKVHLKKENKNVSCKENIQYILERLWCPYLFMHFFFHALVDPNSFIPTPLSEKSLPIPCGGSAEQVMFIHPQDHVSVQWYLPRRFLSNNLTHGINLWRKASLVNWFIHFTGLVKVIWTTMTHNY